MNIKGLTAILAITVPCLHGMAEIIVADTVAAPHKPLSLPLPLPGGQRTIEVRAAIGGNHDTAAWSVTALGDNQHAIRATISFDDINGDPFYKPRLQLRVDSTGPTGRWENIATHSYTRNVELYGGMNSLTMRQHDGIVSVGIGGSRHMSGVAIPFSHDIDSVAIDANRKLKIRYVAVSTAEDRKSRLATAWDEETLVEYFRQSTDPIEGFWKYLDRDIDTRWSVLGGFYRLAIVRNNDGGYDIIYISGAENRAHLWRPGMRKGSMSPTRFENHYDLQWHTTALEDAGPECTADITDSVILRLNLPLHHAAIRFVKE